MTFFSIVTPIYNGVSFFHDYFSSLYSQTFTDWEAILVDDNSSDNSISKVLFYTNTDTRFKLLSSKDFPVFSKIKGPYHPRNIALSVAKGKYVCFLDIDDYWLPDKLYLQHQAIIADPSILVLISRFYKADSSLTKGYLKPVIDIIPIQYQILFWNPIPMLTSCVRFDILKDIYFPPMHHEDFVFWHKVLSALPKGKIFVFQKPLAIYRSSDFSVSSDKRKVFQWWLECFKIFGYPIYISLFFLVIKLLAEFFEFILVFLRIVPIVNLASIIDNPSIPSDLSS